MMYLNHSLLQRSIAVLSIGAVLLLTACSFSSTPTYYTLASTAKALPGSTIRSIEVLPVGLPDRLDRTQLILQDDSGKSKILDLQRWTSALSSELRDGLSSNLQQRLGAVDRYHSGMVTTQPTYRIAADFAHFDILGQRLVDGKSVSNSIDVSVTWSIKKVEITDTNPDRQIACRMDFNTPVDSSFGTGVNAIVIASRQSLDRVSAAVASSILAFDHGTPSTDVVCS